MNNTRKICMLVTSDFRTDPRVNRAVDIASENGFDVFVICRTDSTKVSENERRRDYRVITIGKATRSATVMGIITEKIVLGMHMIKECVKLRPNVIHANDFDTLPFAYIASSIVRGGIIYDSHEIYAGHENIARSRVMRFCVQSLERYLARRVDRVVCVSNAASRYFREAYGINEPTVITNCPRSNVIRMNKHNIFTVLYHGQMVAERGYEELIESARYLRNENVRIVIRGYGPLKTSLEQLIIENNVSDIVTIEDPVPMKDLVRYATSAHIGVVLTKPVNMNYQKTVSNKLYEYINAGLPVIMSPVEEHYCLNEKYQFGVVLSDVTGTSIAKAIVKVKNDLSFYNKLVENAENASAELCWEKEGIKLIGIYDKLMI